MVNYREYAPSPCLAPYVECYWSLKTSGDHRRTTHYRVLPDGCVDILFDENFNEPVTLVGSMTRPILSPLSAHTRLFGVRFRPGGAYPFFNLPMREVTNARVNLLDLWPGTGRLSEQVIGFNVEMQISRVEDALCKRLARSAAPDRRVRAAVSILDSYSGNLPV